MTKTENGSMLSDDHRSVDLILAGVIENLRRENSREAFDALDLFWARLAMHIRAEHLHLFPALLEFSRRAPEVVDILERLRDDHDFFMHELADAIKAMRSMTSGHEAEVMQMTLRRIVTIKARLARHNAIEEEAVYPLQLRLPEKEADQLALSIEKEIENLPPRFHSTA